VGKPLAAHPSRESQRVADRQRIKDGMSQISPTAPSAVRELWAYRELFYFMVWRDIKVRYKQSILGGLWAIIQPFATMLIFTLFFNKLAGIEADNVPYPIFSYSALLPWTYFSGTITQMGNSLVNNQHLITKVYFPRITIPAASAIRGLVDFAIASTILFGMMVYYQYVPDWTLILWALLLVPLVGLAMGVGMIFAAVNVKYRDVQHILPFVVQIWLFITPIIWPMSMIPEKYRLLVALNPLAGIIEAFRACVVPTHALDLQLFGISMAMTAAIFVVGALYFRRTARGFADII
jgi:lipopolysaccharide transport system permease protein